MDVIFATSDWEGGQNIAEIVMNSSFDKYPCNVIRVTQCSSLKVYDLLNSFG